MHKALHPPISLSFVCFHLLSVSRSLIAWVLLTGLSLSLSLSPAQTQKGSLVEEGRGGKMTLMAPGAITAASVRGSGVTCDEIPHVHSQGDSPVSAAEPSPHYHLPGVCQAQVPSWRCCACSNIHLPFCLFTCSTALAYKMKRFEKSFSSYLLKSTIPFFPLLKLVYSSFHCFSDWV